MKKTLHFKKATSLFLWSIALMFLLVTGKVSGQTTLFSDSFGTTSGTFPTGWTSSNTTNGFAAVTTSASSTYSGASGSVNARFANSGTNGNVLTLTYSNSLSTVGYSSITVIWGARSTATFTQPVTFQWSSDGSTWNNVSFTNVSNNATWALVNGGTRISLPSGAAGISNLRFRWSITANNSGNYQIDDFSVQGTPPVSAPGAPTIGTITPGNGQLSVAFTAPTSNGGATITDYKCSINSGTYFPLGTTASPFVLSSLTNGTSYSITIKAVNSAGDGTASNSVSGTPRTVPSASTITGITPGNGNLSVAFTSGSNGGATVTNYKYSLDGGSSFTAFSPAQTTSPVSISGLTNGTAYNVQLVAVNAAGDGAASNTISATPITTPSAVTGFAVTEGNSQLSLAFIAGANGGSAITNYEYSLNGGSTFTSAGATTSPIVITGLTNGTTYFVQLRAINAAGNGVATTSVSATPRTISDAPSITAITAGNSQLSVAFSAPAFNGGTAITNYKYSLNGGSTFVSAGTTSSPFLITGLSNGTTYDVKLLAVTAAGDGTPSSTVQGTPVAPATPTILATKTSLNALSTIYGTASTTDSFNVSGASLSGDITVTAPTGFEISTTSSSTGFASSQVLTQTSGSVVSTTVYVRLKASASAVSSPYSGDVVISSLGAANVNVATTSSSVAVKGLTITGLTGVDKTYDGSSTATVSGTATLNGIVGSDDVSVSGTPSYSFTDAIAGTNKSITVSGYTLTGANAANYSVSQPTYLTATINKAGQTITAISLTETRTFGNNPYSVSTTASSGLVVSYSSSNTSVATVDVSGNVTIVGAGSTTITASQGGNANYNAASNVVQALTVNKADQDLTAITATVSKVYGDAAYSASSTASSGLIVSYSSSNTSVATVASNGLVTIVGAGTTTITASQSGNTNYNPAVSVSQELTVAKANQTITLAATDAKTTATAPYTLSQNASSGLAIVYTSSNLSVATISGNTVTIVGAGTTTITANQAGNLNYNPATAVTQTLTVSQVAAPIVGWDMSTMAGGTNNFGTSPLTPNTSNSNATNGSLTRGSGVVTTGSGASRGWGGLGWNYTTADLAIAANRFITFTTKAKSGYTMSLSSLNPFGYRASGTGAASVALQYQINSGSFTTITTFTGLSTSTSGGTFASTDLTGVAALQDLPSTSTVTFRIVPFGASSATGTFYIFDTANTTANDLVVNGFLNQLPAPSITSSLTANGRIGSAFTYATTATNSPSSYSATGLPSGLTINTTSGAISGTPTAAGTFNVSLSATNGTGTDTKTLVITIVQANQVITFNTLSGKTYGDASFSLNGTSTSGLALTYSSSNTAVATISGNTVTIVGAGTTSITASQSGDANYFAASDVSRDLVVAKANQTITFNTLSDKNDTDGSFTLGATASSGLTVSYSSSNTSVVSISGSTATIVAPGTTTITASQAGNDNYNAATSVDQSQTIINTSLANQTITFGPLSPVTYGDGTFALNGTIDSSLAITYVSSNPSVASVSGNVVTILTPGTTTITASQAGDSTHNPATSVSQSLVVNTKTLTISNIVVANKDYNGTAAATITSADLNGVVGADNVTLSNTAVFASANAGSGIAVTPNFVLNGTDASRYTLTQPTGLVANINKVNQTILFDAIPTKSFGDAAFNLIATGGASGLPVTFTSSDSSILTISGNVATIIGVGDVTITASQAGNTNYNAASDVSQTITVNKANQVITFNALVNRTTADTSFTLGGSASSALPLSYASSNSAVATISGNVVTIVGPGSTIITASQAGNNLYNAATDVNQTQVVLTAISKWTFDAITTTGSGSNVPVTGSAVADQGLQTSGSLFSANHASSSTVWSNPSGNGSAKSVSSTFWAVGDYWQFKLNTSNYHTLAIAVDQTGSSTGPSTFKIQYSTNGTSYTDLPGGTYTLDATGWSTSNYRSAAVRSFDLSSITTLNNKSAVYIRLVDANTTSIGNGTVATGGSSRVDNFVITGIACNTIAGITNNTNTNVLTCDTATIALTATGGTSYSWSNGTNVVGTSENLSVTAAGTYTVTVTSANGCSSTASVVITENKTTTSEESATACDTYTWNGTTYTASGDYTYTSTNASGCTNTATLHLTINNSSVSEETQTTCVSYTWHGITYTTSGDYTYTSTNPSGCNNVATLHLTINSLSTYYVDADGDGFGSTTEASLCAASAPSGYSSNNTDCNDAVYSATNTCSSIVNLKLNIQGYYDADAHAMRAVMANQGVGSSATDVDDVTVELRDSGTSALVASVTARLHTDGTAVATFTTAPIGSFYIAVRHRNTLETWSSAPQTVGATPLTYDFTTAATKAYGSNMIQLESGVYGFYTGDINQDGFIEALDYPQLFNDSDNLLEGYQTTDLNGDGFVEALDYPILFNNSDNLIETLHP